MRKDLRWYFFPRFISCVQFQVPGGEYLYNKYLSNGRLLFTFLCFPIMLKTFSNYYDWGGAGKLF